ncbi:hypothetical protein DFH09DRAFT_1317822 [Mycena vulgaris]|nr:hypothetical protein DFH09DRAFT_1317822 [Mycena vulgaris]
MTHCPYFFFGSAQSTPDRHLTLDCGAAIASCVVALGPSLCAFAPAIGAQEPNTPFNTACLVAAAKGTAPFPASCSPCAAPLGITDPAKQVTPTLPIISTTPPTKLKETRLRTTSALLGANTPLNTGCLTTATKGAAPFPGLCGGCAAQFGAPKPANNVAAGTITGNTGAIGSGMGRIGSAGGFGGSSGGFGRSARGPRARVLSSLSFVVEESNSNNNVRV